jgi:purine-nucleoside/S-methyl-5'-thioadenosine phosphorylase / adenosine deaminase
MWTLDARPTVPAWRASGCPGATLAFSTRRGGVSEGPYQSLNLGRSTDDRPEAVDENRRRLLSSLGLDPDHFANAGQVHGSAIVRVTAPGLHPECDALVTTVPGLTLAVTAADCLPILYEAPGAVAAAHSGWRGTAAGAPEVALAAICAAASVLPEEVHIHLGPCIRGCCYQVGPEVAAAFPAAALRSAEGSQFLDLPTAVRLRLIAAGAPEGAIHDTGACTSCEPHWYFSHRRDRGLTGRQWGVVALTG